jgi:hypothetical protein
VVAEVQVQLVYQQLLMVVLVDQVLHHLFLDQLLLMQGVGVAVQLLQQAMLVSVELVAVAVLVILRQLEREERLIQEVVLVAQVALVAL